MLGEKTVIRSRRKWDLSNILDLTKEKARIQSQASKNLRKRSKVIVFLTCFL